MNKRMTTAMKPQELKQRALERWENEGGHVSRNSTTESRTRGADKLADARGEQASKRAGRKPAHNPRPIHNYEK
jgi:hypothetical protein